MSINELSTAKFAAQVDSQDFTRPGRAYLSWVCKASFAKSKAFAEMGKKCPEHVQKTISEHTNRCVNRLVKECSGFASDRGLLKALSPYLWRVERFELNTRDQVFDDPFYNYQENYTVLNDEGGQFGTVRIYFQGHQTYEVKGLLSELLQIGQKKDFEVDDMTYQEVLAFISNLTDPIKLIQLGQIVSTQLSNSIYKLKNFLTEGSDDDCILELTADTFVSSADPIREKVAS